jgi:hypothetical protein
MSLHVTPFPFSPKPKKPLHVAPCPSQHNARHSKAMQSKAMQSKNKTKQNNAKQCKTQQSNAKQCKRPNPRDTNSKAIIRPGTSLALEVLALASQRTLLMHQPYQLKVVYPTLQHHIGLGGEVLQNLLRNGSCSGVLQHRLGQWPSQGRQVAST